MVFNCKLLTFQEYQRAIIFRLGRTIKNGKPLGPGIFFIIPCMDHVSLYIKHLKIADISPGFLMFQIMICDLRTLTFDVPPQEILTKDSVTVTVDAVVYYKIFSPTFAVINVKDYSKSTKLLAATTLRSILGTKTLAEVLSDREQIAQNLLSQLDEATDPWGVKVLLHIQVTKIKTVNNKIIYHLLRLKEWNLRM